MSRMMTTSLRFHFVHLAILHLAIFSLHFAIALFMKEVALFMKGVAHLLLRLFLTHSLCFIFLY